MPLLTWQLWLAKDLVEDLHFSWQSLSYQYLKLVFQDTREKKYTKTNK